MTSSVTITGDHSLLSRLSRLRSPESVLAIGVATVYAGCGVVTKAIRDAAPGSIKQEVGMYVRATGSKVVGKSGLMAFPKRGEGQNGPHGVYLDRGTKFIAAWRFTESAARSAAAVAKVAMKQAAKRKMAHILAAST